MLGGGSVHDSDVWGRNAYNMGRGACVQRYNLAQTRPVTRIPAIRTPARHVHHRPARALVMHTPPTHIPVIWGAHEREGGGEARVCIAGTCHPPQKVYVQGNHNPLHCADQWTPTVRSATTGSQCRTGMEQQTGTRAGSGLHPFVPVPGNAASRSRVGTAA
mmetsp:Transcript_58905/g.96768  ORF Transcript_58905/g.96768 Transcript_58905/m.96768 type:complete len:161 (+) Transcript_58905:2093-2575(+)